MFYNKQGECSLWVVLPFWPDFENQHWFYVDVNDSFYIECPVIYRFEDETENFEVLDCEVNTVDL